MVSQEELISVETAVFETDAPGIFAVGDVNCSPASLS
jgi:hypothetical protein